MRHYATFLYKFTIGSWENYFSNVSIWSEWINLQHAWYIKGSFMFIFFLFVHSREYQLNWCWFIHFNNDVYLFLQIKLTIINVKTFLKSVILCTQLVRWKQSVPLFLVTRGCTSVVFMQIQRFWIFELLNITFYWNNFYFAAYFVTYLTVQLSNVITDSSVDELAWCHSQSLIVILSGFSSV